jgi:hypothetical protein
VILFWDKNTPKTIPLALRTLNIPVRIEIYLEHWPLSDTAPEGGDDRWLSQVGTLGWTVISQDYHFHERENERHALKQYSIGCFYLWGAEARKWDIARCFARAYDNIIDKAATTPRPFIYWVSRSGKLTLQPIP